MFASGKRLYSFSICSQRLVRVATSLSIVGVLKNVCNGPFYLYKTQADLKQNQLTFRLKTESAYVQTEKASAQKFTAVENFLNLSPEIKVLHI